MGIYLELAGRPRRPSDKFLMASKGGVCPIYYHLCVFHKLYLPEASSIPRVNLMRSAGNATKMQL